MIGQPFLFYFFLIFKPKWNQIKQKGVKLILFLDYLDSKMLMLALITCTKELGIKWYAQLFTQHLIQILLELTLDWLKFIQRLALLKVIINLKEQLGSSVYQRQGKNLKESQLRQVGALRRRMELPAMC